MHFDTPILFIIFNRIETETRVFEVIKKIKPSKLYIVADGPRRAIDKEELSCEKARNYILDNINWKCEILTKFRKNNLGCKKSIQDGITWFFKHEEKGIIIEDDCLPDISFFGFADRMLEKYKSDDRIMMISGTNHQFDNPKANFSYYFSKFFPVWGWATWRRAWQKYDSELSLWKKDDFGQVLKQKIHKDIFNYYKKIFNEYIVQRIDTWDIQWAESCLYNDGYCIIPRSNLVSNIGYVGTHSSKKDRFHEMPTFPINVRQLKDGEPDEYNPIIDLEELRVINKKENIEKILNWLKIPCLRNY